jgi:ABC-type branched-subunit amino acid transport system ATPase component
MTLEVTDLAGGYREGVTVFSGVSFSVAGGALGFIGRNGAGKTCLAQTLSGAQPATAGSIKLDGKELRGRKSRWRVRTGVSLVPEGRQVFGQLSVQENLVVSAYAAGRGRSRIAEMEERFPILGEKRQRPAASLSGGEQQLLAIARALVQEPKVIILDEPSLGLSPIAVDRLTDSLKQVLDSSNVVMVLMEQNGELLTGLCDKVLLVEQGEVIRSLNMHDADDQAALYQSYLGV